MTNMFASQLLFILLLGPHSALATDDHLRPTPATCAGEWLEGGAASTARALLSESNFARYVPLVIALPGDHAGFRIIPTAPIGTRAHLLGDLEHSSPRWPLERWDAYGQPHFFVDVGLINLREDALLVNGFVLGELLSPDRPVLSIEHDHGRQNDLIHLHRWRDALAHDDLRADNSHVDTIGVLRAKLPWRSATEDIVKQTVISAQIHHGRSLNYVVPNVSSLLSHINSHPAAADPLPVLSGHDSLRGELRRDFEHRFAGEATCELTFPRGDLAFLPANAQLRFMYQALERAERRGCEVLIINLNARLTRLMVSTFGFSMWRANQARDEAPRLVSFLRLHSAEYVSVMGNLLDVIGAEDERNFADGDRD